MANVVANPRFWKKKAILIKREVTVGVDAEPTGAANWIEARNVTFQPFDVETADRNIEAPYMGNGGKLITGKYSTLSFELALVGPGVPGGVPKFAPLLFAAAFAETLTEDTAAAYSLVSSNIESVTAYINIDQVTHKMVGCRCNVALTMSAKGIPLLRIEMQSIYTVPVAEAPPVVDREGWPIEQPVTAATTSGMVFGATTLAYSTFELNLGNQLARIDLPGPQVEVAITDRKPTGSVTVLAPGLGVFDPFALATAGTVVDVTTTQDSRIGHKAKVDAKVRIIGVEYDRIEEMLAYKLTLEPTPVAGNDEITLTYL
ncbi:phage tail tube protein [Thauera butanivorans]|uniref:phage tail tube protein n=1 Tax=Thauera butanivorans TaxID=86174 RepID=UPI003AB6321E